MRAQYDSLIAAELSQPTAADQERRADELLPTARAVRSTDPALAAKLASDAYMLRKAMQLKAGRGGGDV